MAVLAGLMTALALSVSLPERSDNGCPGNFVFFAPGSAKLDRQARLILSDSAIWMAQAVREGRGGTWVTIVATNDEGEAAPGDRRLSQRRADSVRNFLARRGIPKGFIRAVGGGAGGPLLGAETADQVRATERRAQAGLGMTQEAWQRAFPPGVPIC